MKHTWVSFPGLMFSKRNRCFLKEAVGSISFYTYTFTFRLNLDSTPHEGEHKEFECSSAAAISFFPAFILVQHGYEMMVFIIQCARGVPFLQGLGASIHPHITAGQKAT